MSSDTINYRCDVPITEMNNEPCAKWEQHNGPCMTYQEVMLVMVDKMCKLYGFKGIEDVDNNTVNMLTIKASFMYRTKVVRRE